MKMRYAIGAMVFVIVCGLIGTCIWLNNKIPHMGYVDLKEIYNDFKMTKELDAVLSKVQQQRKMTLDSMELKLKFLIKKIESTPEKERKEITESLQLEKQEYFQRKQQFDTDDQNTVRQYNDQVWKQLNQYVKDFGKENHFTYLFGADGTGTLMYGGELQEVTPEVKRYVNEHYKGQSK
jgi:outer membrane protein